MTQMGFFAWLIVGAIAGWLAGKVMGTSRQQGLLLDIVVGIAGALIGGFLFSQFGAEGTTGFNIWSIFVAFTGAVVLLGVIHLVSGRRVKIGLKVVHPHFPCIRANRAPADVTNRTWHDRTSGV
jgi:uncharacterized membrane protein YeaQ/YmgE (transglycosylase-associated protein family)